MINSNSSSKACNILDLQVLFYRWHLNMETNLMILCDSLKCYTLWGVTLKTKYKIRLSVVLLI